MADPIRFDDFSAGLWLGGGRDKAPDTSLRRAQNVHTLMENAVRSRPGSELLQSLAAHSITRFGDARYFGVGTELKDGAVTVKTGLTGAPLSFAAMGPTAEVEAQLFVANGGPLFKVKRDTNEVTNWGIAPPPDGFTAVAVDDQDRQLASFDHNDALIPGNTWGLRGDAGTFVVVADPVNKVAGAASHKIQARKANALIGLGALFNVSGTELDLTLMDGGIESSDQDYITLQIRIRQVDTVERIEIYMDDTPQAGFFESYYGVAITPERQGKISTEAATGAVPGLADLADDESKREFTPTEAATINRTLGATTFPIMDDAWTKLRIPKTAFTHFGSLASEGGVGQGWAKIEAVNILFKLSNTFADVSLNPDGSTPADQGAFIWVDELRLEGGAGLMGTYKYHVTYRNSVTGTRSNPNPTPVVIKDIQRNRIFLDNLPMPTDPQVDQVEVWRTVGNGERFFLAHRNDVGDADFTDVVSDYAGSHPLDGEEVLQDEELPLDNDAPYTAFPGFFECFGPHLGRMWWLSSTAGKRGLLYYSPAGRAEAVEGFIEITDDDDPTQRIILWNGSLYVVSEGGWHQVFGDDEPFIPREVWGAPGVPAEKRRTVVATPRGVLYEADDGPRLFDGARTTLIGVAQVLPLFRNESPGGMSAFNGVFAAYGRNEWFISDGVYILAYDVQRTRWREITTTLGAVNALFYDNETEDWIVSIGSTVLGFEREGVGTDAGELIPFRVITPERLIDAADEGVVHFLFIEANTSGVELIPTLILDDVDFALPTLSSTSRQIFEYPINRKARRVRIELEGSANAHVEVHNFTVDVRNGQGRAYSQ